jgi:UDP-2,3-diacylglucosamine hydrolase
VHLGAYSDDKNRDLEDQLIRLIDYCRDQGLEIVILGDFFDYWMEYPGGRVPPIGQRVLEHFRRYHAQTGSHTLFVTGNHDNWTNGYLCGLGFDLEHEYRIIQDDNAAIMVLHGDGLNDPDMGLQRPRMHRFLRNSYFITLYQTLLPPRLGWAGMRLFSGSSRKKDVVAPDSLKRVELDAWARNRVSTDNRIQAVIYGHHHHPVLWEQQGLTCMNCGSFGENYSLGLYANKTFEIVTWDAESNLLATGLTAADT